MIPQTDSKTGYLPQGVHEADWDEVAGRFGGNDVRDVLVRHLFKACLNLAQAGCTKLLLDGSFVTAKSEPGDYDGTWETDGVDENRLDPVLLGEDATGFAKVRAKYLGDLYPAHVLAELGEVPFRDFFQTDRDGVVKGVVLLNLRSLP